MVDIDNEISQVAENMAKSTTSTRELLIAQINQLGPEGLKKSIPNLSPEHKLLLKSILEDMEKGRGPDLQPRSPRGAGPRRGVNPILDAQKETLSVEEQAKKIERQKRGKEREEALKLQSKGKQKPKEDVKKGADVSMDDVYTPPKTSTPNAILTTEAQTGSDNADEKLMKEKANQHKHQGDNTPEGLEGQVIKSYSPAGGSANIVKSEEEEKAEAEKKKKDAEVKKSNEESAMENTEEFIKGMNKDTMYKALETMHNKGIEKEAMYKAMLEKGANKELMDSCYTELEKSFGAGNGGPTMVKSEDESKESAAHEKKEKEGKEKKEDKEEVKKSIAWNVPNPLAANTLGRNHHVEVNDLIEQNEKDVEEVKKSGSYMNDGCEYFEKSLFNKPELTCSTVECERTKDAVCREMLYKLKEMRKMKDSKYLIEKEVPETKDIFEKKYSSLKAEVKKLHKEYGSLKKSETNINDMLEKGQDLSVNDVRDAEMAKSAEAKGAYTTQSFSLEEMAKSMSMTVDEAKEVLGIKDEE